MIMYYLEIYNTFSNSLEKCFHCSEISSEPEAQELGGQLPSQLLDRSQPPFSPHPVLKAASYAPENNNFDAKQKYNQVFFILLGQNKINKNHWMNNFVFLIKKTIKNKINSRSSLHNWPLLIAWLIWFQVTKMIQPSAQRLTSTTQIVDWNQDW